MTRIATYNGKGFPAQRQRTLRADLVEIRDRIQPDLLAVQEFWLLRFRTSLRRVFRPSRYGRRLTYGWSGTGVVWDTRRFTLLASGRERLHGIVIVGGRVVSSARKIAWARLRDTADGEVITFASVHFTPSAFSGRFSGARKARVRRAWDEGAENLREFIEHNVRHGHVVVAGDFNARRGSVDAAGVVGEFTDPRGHIAGQVLRAPGVQAGDVDHVLLIGRWYIASVGRRGMNSDHDARYVEADAL